MTAAANDALTGGGLDIVREISPNDGMYRSSPDYYFWWGEKGLECVQLLLRLAGPSTIKRILDLPCGHGRVLRYLASAFPSAEIFACDLDSDAVSFCADTFGAVPVQSYLDPHQIELDARFDVIWCGSLVTHLDAERWTPFLEVFSKLLSDDGLLVFTTHGPHFVHLVRQRKLRVYVPDDPELLADYERLGFGYRNYPNAQSYGISLSSPAWVVPVLARSGLSLRAYVERGWGGLQDAYACSLQ